MAKNFLLFFSFLLISNWYSAQIFQKDNWYDFEGKIADKPVVLSLFIFENGEIKGNYFYRQKEIKIQLIGELKEDTVRLTDTNKNTFIMKVIDNNSSNDKTDLAGQYLETINNKTSELNFLLKSNSDGTFEHRYSRFEASDEEVEKFAKEVLNALLTDNKSWLKNNCYYPLMAEFENSTFGSILNKEQFVNRYSIIVPKEMKINLSKARTLNLQYEEFAGAIIGVDYNKYITINEFPDPVTKKLILVISSITHY
ncbi:hypothetical protein [Chryseobacterium luquanense]|uniref:DUF4369 domain-containing protein n=1 Tax=Chryseobacterium luquanense TaxID=2983766 RepID=A0ABT3Y116_9FLAO|nr:hypothetical protein [Chryseobacterium luquanense]MCX8531832.1 hypothetical protein [Chryseobacterium luquanense]